MDRMCTFTRNIFLTQRDSVFSAIRIKNILLDELNQSFGTHRQSTRVGTEQSSRSSQIIIESFVFPRMFLLCLNKIFASLKFTGNMYFILYQLARQTFALPSVNLNHREIHLRQSSSVVVYAWRGLSTVGQMAALGQRRLLRVRRWPLGRFDFNNNDDVRQLTRT